MFTGLNANAQIIIVNSSYGLIQFKITDADKKELAFYGTGTSWIGAIPSKVTYQGEQYTVTSIDDYADFNTYGKTVSSITLPATIKKIGDYAFSASEFKTINLSNSVEYIGEGVFTDCDNLQKVTVNSSFIIPAGTFEGSLQLTDVEIKNKDNLYYTSVDGVLYSKQQDTVVYFPCGKKSSSFQIPETVKVIGNGAFYNCSLQEITIPKSITHIMERAFQYPLDNKLQKITCLSPNPPTTELDKFGRSCFYNGSTSKPTLYIPYLSKTAYQQAEVWKDFTDIQYLRDVITVDTTITACGGFTLNNKNLQTGFYSDTIHYENYDSIVNLTLIVKEPVKTYINANIYDGEEYSFAGKNISAAGIYYDTLEANNSCDSIIILHLSVNAKDTVINIVHDTVTNTVHDTTILTQIDTITLHDTIINKITLYDTVTLHDTIETTLYDTVTLFDTIETTLYDTVTLFDTIETTLYDTVTLFDTIETTLYDTVTLFDTIETTLYDTVTLFDTIETTLYDTVTLHDTIETTLYDTVTLHDTIETTLYDTVTLHDTIETTLYDTVTLHDTIETTLYDTVTLHDTIETTLYDTVTLFDTIETTLYDTVTLFDTIETTLYDTVTLHDTIETTLYDTVTLHDTIETTLYDTVTLFDTIETTLYDTVTLFDTIETTLYDTVTLHDTIETTLYDTVTLHDTIETTLYDTVTLFDTITVTQTVHDTVNTVDTLTVTEYDTVTLIDTITVTQIDTVTVTDTITVTLYDTVNTIDTVYLHDTITPCGVTRTYIYAEINAGETYTGYGFTESDAREYTLNLQTDDGCDSIVTLILQVTAGIEEIQQGRIISIYPNPAKDKVTIHADGDIKIIDNKGQVICEIKNIKGVKDINVSDFEAGVYYINVGKFTQPLIIE